MSHLNAGSPLSRITHKTEEFWNGRLYFPVMLAVTAVSMLTGNVVPSTVLLVLLCGWMLVFCRDILAAALPFLLIFLLSTLQYTSLSVFLPCAPLAVVPIGGLLVHLLRWRKPLAVGSCAAGLAALRSYRRQWRPRQEQFSSGPLHDGSSHAADALRYAVTGFRPPERPLPPARARISYDVLGLGR